MGVYVGRNDVMPVHKDDFRRSGTHIQTGNRIDIVDADPDRDDPRVKLWLYPHHAEYVIPVCNPEALIRTLQDCMGRIGKD